MPVNSFNWISDNGGTTIVRNARSNTKCTLNLLKNFVNRISIFDASTFVKMLPVKNNYGIYRIELIVSSLFIYCF